MEGFKEFGIIIDSFDINFARHSEGYFYLKIKNYDDCDCVIKIEDDFLLKDLIDGINLVSRDVL